MSNSSLVTYTKLSPNCYKPRKYPISRFTIHHMAWVMCTSKKCADSFASPSRSASATYCIGYDGDISQSVKEENAPWTSSSYDNDNRAITFEVANSKGGPNWEVSDKSYKALINLMVDCCKRNGKTKVIWLGDKEKSLAYKPASNEMLMTVHRWFSSTACPGPYLMSKMGDIANKVNAQLQKAGDPVQSTPEPIETKEEDSVEKKIWDFLKSKGLNDFAVAGIMGNLRAESALSPINLQNSFEKKLGYNDKTYTQAVDKGTYNNFIHDGAGYGLAQWTYYSRKQGLLMYARSQNKSIGDLQMQLEFLWKEMQNYTTMMSELKSANTIRDASNSFLFRFERPANQGAGVQDARTNYGVTYYNKFSNKVPTETAKETTKLYKVQVGAFKEKANAEKRVKYLATIEVKAIIKQAGSYYKVQAGAFSKKSNAEALLTKIQNAGFEDAYITYG